MGVEEDRIVVNPRTRIPEPPRSIPIASLQALELDTGMGVGKVIGIAAAVAGATVLGIFLILMAVIDD